jgi:hypothetical protein
MFEKPSLKGKCVVFYYVINETKYNQKDKCQDNLVKQETKCDEV